MWEVFKDWIFALLAWFQGFCGDWGLAILLITLIFRLLITPLMHMQQKSSYMMQKIQPQLNKIKERFPDDQQRQNEETQKLYAETKFNPLLGCVPMLIQIPIFIALFQVLREMGDRVADGQVLSFFNIVPNLVLTPADTFAIGLTEFFPYAILMAIFAFATFIPMFIQSKDNPQNAGMMRGMSVVMSIMMLWISWSSPAGVLLFWGASSLLALLQMYISKKILKKQDEKKAAEASPYEDAIDINVTRTVKKKRNRRKR